MCETGQGLVWDKAMGIRLGWGWTWARDWAGDGPWRI